MKAKAKVRIVDLIRKEGREPGGQEPKKSHGNLSILTDDIHFNDRWMREFLAEETAEQDLGYGDIPEIRIPSRKELAEIYAKSRKDLMRLQSKQKRERRASHRG